MELFTCALALGLALNPISEGYIEYSTPANPDYYVSYGDLKDYSHVLIDTSASVGFLDEIIYGNFSFTGLDKFQHITFGTGVQYKFNHFTPYFELYGNYLNDEKSPLKEKFFKSEGFSEQELGLKLGLKLDFQLVKVVNFIGDFNLGYEFNDELTLNSKSYLDNEWKDTSITCDYLSDMFRVHVRIGAKFFNMVSIYGGLESWQIIGYSEDTGSVFGGSTPCMIRNELGCEFKTNFKHFNPYVNITYLCQHPEKPYDHFNKQNHPDDYLSEQFNYNNMEIKAGVEYRF